MKSKQAKKKAQMGRPLGSGRYGVMLRCSITKEMDAKLVQRQAATGERTISDVVRKILAKDLGTEP
jgi:hypothetical protein